VMPAEKFEAPSAAPQAAITAAICDGEAEGNRCDTCPESAPQAGGGFSLKRVVMGHFLSRTSVDAMATISGCEQMHASIGWGYLLTEREGNWEVLDEVLGLDLEHCRRMQFRSGRQLLVCEDYRMESFHLMQSVTAVFAKGESIGF